MKTLALILASVTALPSCVCPGARRPDQAQARDVLRRHVRVPNDRTHVFSVAEDVARQLELSLVQEGPVWDKDVAFRFRHASVSRVLRDIARQTGLCCGVSHEALYIGPRDRLAEIDRLTPLDCSHNESMRRALAKTVGFCWPDAQPLVDMAGFVAAICELRIVCPFGEDLMVGRDTTVLIEDMQCRNALRWLAVLSGTDLRVKDDTITFVPRKAELITNDQKLRQSGAD